MHEAYWRHTPLREVNISSYVDFLPLTFMYVGAKVTLCLSALEYGQRGPDIQRVLKHAQDFLIEIFPLRKHFPIVDPIIQMLQVIDPEVRRSFTVSFIGSSSLKIPKSDSSG